VLCLSKVKTTNYGRTMALQSLLFCSFIEENIFENAKIDRWSPLKVNNFAVSADYKLLLSRYM